MTRRFTFKRESYVPSGSAKVRDKASGAVAFVYVTGKGRPAAIAFHGQAQKPDWHHVFPSEMSRERAVRAHFERHRQAAVRKAEDRAAAARPHGFEMGHVLVASWGYEQTNVDFYQVTAIVGRCMVEVRKIASGDASTGKEPWATGKSVPTLDAFTGPALRRRVNGASRCIRIDDVCTAFIWDGRPRNWTAYA